MNADTDTPNLVLNINTSVVPNDKGSKVQKAGPAKSEQKQSTSADHRTTEKPPIKKRQREFYDADDSRRRDQLDGPPRKKEKFSSLFDHDTYLPDVDVEVTDTKNEPVFSSSQFTEFDIHPHIVSCLADRFGITTATEIQKLTIPVLLRGKDALVKSHTGSGKTLAYAIPIVQRLQEVRPKLSRNEGIYAVVIVPTRELALQTYECFEKLTKACTWIVPGVLMGGEKKKSEKARIRKGLNIVIGTPGRFIDHLEHTESFTLRNATWLAIDEADRLLELGFEESVAKILTVWKEQKATVCSTSVLLSATLSKGVERLAGLALNDPVTLDVAVEAGAAELEELVLPPGLSQFYVQVPIKLSLMTLACLVLEACVADAQKRSKIIVFMATQDVVDFEQSAFSAVLGSMFEDTGRRINFFKLHGEMSQHDRAEVFKKFREASTGVLFTTDVASRGLDVPQVDLIVQCCVPLRAEDYVHRAGRTARIGAEGKVVMMLLPSETRFLQVLADRHIALKKMDVSDVLKGVFAIKQQILDARTEKGAKLRSMEDYVTALQLIFEHEVNTDKDLLGMAKKGYLSHVRSYASYPKAMREVVLFKQLHLGHLAKAYCLREAPKVLGADRSAPIHGSHKEKAMLQPKQRRQKMVEVSEYDSGIGKGRTKKRKKGKK
ncbi:probable ATP-dependent RNA helicase DDX31 [Ornithodoros turicata]|uniref:probable ATP-dependent RNA helicase DDX31 n=1 Tax=Ornithodoros turicata TaxID=34597 RepID=UPI003139920D